MKAENPHAFLRWYSYAFSAVAVVGAVVGKEWVTVAALVASVNIACTYHICKAITRSQGGSTSE